MGKNIFLGLCCVLVLLGCSDEKTAKKEMPNTMKCGVGKCGAALAEGSGTLVKKKNNILSQMRDDDPRRECVLNANTTKEVYDCVRSPITQRLTTKCGNTTQEN